LAGRIQDRWQIERIEVIAEWCADVALKLADDQGTSADETDDLADVVSAIERVQTRRQRVELIMDLGTDRNGPVRIRVKTRKRTRQQRSRRRRIRTSRTIRKELMRDDPCCWFCGACLLSGQATFDHFVPHSKGGETSKANGVLACNACNDTKADLPAELMVCWQRRGAGIVRVWDVPGVRIFTSHKRDSETAAESHEANLYRSLISHRIKKGMY